MLNSLRTYIILCTFALRNGKIGVSPLTKNNKTQITDPSTNQLKNDGFIELKAFVIITKPALDILTYPLSLKTHLDGDFCAALKHNRQRKKQKQDKSYDQAYEEFVQFRFKNYQTVNHQHQASCGKRHDA